MVVTVNRKSRCGLPHILKQPFITGFGDEFDIGSAFDF